MTEIGIRHAFWHCAGTAYRVHAFKESRQWCERLDNRQYEVVIYSVAENRDSRQECVRFLAHQAAMYPDAFRILLAEDEREADLVQHLSPIALNGVLCKSTSIARFKGQLKALLTQSESSKFSAPPLHHSHRCVGLSPTERIILNYMGKGLSISEIALQMERNAKTIRTHKFNVMNKLGVSNDSDLLCAADILRYQPL
jgi:Response regulator containing a CheY-like receiver domain and an HTH DNA-binding domain